jgi:hypothetical protein
MAGRRQGGELPAIGRGVSYLSTVHGRLSAAEQYLCQLQTRLPFNRKGRSSLQYLFS